ncbi:MAG TPA: hypothetical protein VEW42_02125 [Candidatus Eisenbacteria bacterium]|nr:hypothetical protein [Candidatus Eisenbacteria bacterium]
MSEPKPDRAKPAPKLSLYEQRRLRLKGSTRPVVKDNTDGASLFGGPAENIVRRKPTRSESQQADFFSTRDGGERKNMSFLTADQQRILDAAMDADIAEFYEEEAKRGAKKK